MSLSVSFLDKAVSLVCAITHTLRPNLQFQVFSLLLTLSCMSDPMGPARKQIKNFKKNHSDQMGIHQGIHRKISYAFAGNSANRPVLFIHGSPGSQEGWYAYLQNEKLTEKFHLLDPDRPGYGESEKGVTETSLTKQAEDLWSLLSLNKSGLTPILVGHSYGAPVVAKMAMMYPEVYAVILVAGSIDPALEEDLFIQKLGRLPLIRSVIPNSLRVANEEITALKGEMSQKDYDWSKIKAKVYAIHGTEDDLVPKENMDYLKKNFPGAKITMMKDNHFIPWNHPEKVIELVELSAQ